MLSPPNRQWLRSRQLQVAKYALRMKKPGEHMARLWSEMMYVRSMCSILICGPAPVPLWPLTGSHCVVRIVWRALPGAPRLEDPHEL